MKSSNKSALNLKTQSYKKYKGKFQVSKVTNFQSQIGLTNSSTRALLTGQVFSQKELNGSFDLQGKIPTKGAKTKL